MEQVTVTFVVGVPADVRPYDHDVHVELEHERRCDRAVAAGHRWQEAHYHTGFYVAEEEPDRG